jgi:hypothetical protein
MGWTTGESGFESQQGRIFFPPRSVHTDPGAQAAFCPVGDECKVDGG